jgi:hypothetical protein
MDKGQSEELRSLLDKVGPARAKARQVIRLENGRYTVDWALDFRSTLVPHLDACRNVTRLLNHDAFLRAQDNDIEGAWASGQAALNTVGSIGDEPCLISHLNRCACGWLAVQTLERILAQGEPAPAVLIKAQRFLEKQDREIGRSLLNALRGERALAHRAMAAIETGDLSLAHFLSTSPKKKELSWWDRASDFFSGGMVQHSHAVYLRHITDLIDIARLPINQQVIMVQTWKPTDLEGEAPLAWLLLPAMDKVVSASHRQQACLRCAIAGLAAERYRRRHGRWPETLAALVTDKLLREVPTDPYDGQPLRLQKTKDGVVIYSIGPDGEDNGGNLDRENPTAEGADLGLQLWDVAKRRQPPVQRLRPADPQ